MFRDDVCYLVRALMTGRYYYSESGIHPPGAKYFDVDEHLKPPAGLRLICERGTEVPDCMFPMLLSDRCLRLFRRHLRLCERVGWVPVTAMDRRRRPLGVYWCPHIPHCRNDQIIHEVLDRKRSKYRPRTGPVLHVTEWVLDGRRLPEEDLFYGSGWKFFGSKRLVTLVWAEGLTAFDLQPVRVWYDRDPG